MKWKSTLFLLAATVGIGAYVSLYELKTPTEQQRKRQSQYIINLKPETVTQIVLDLPRAKTTLTRQAALWVLGPGNLRADSNNINRLLSETWPLSAERNLSSSKQPLEPKTFGLDPALGSVAFTANGSTATLTIGEPTPVGNSRYVKLAGRPDIFIVSNRFFSAFDMPLEFFRDHALARINRRLCKDIELKSNAAAWHAAKENGSWQLKAPYIDKADPVEIAGVLTQLEQLRISKFITDAPTAEQLSLYGLDSPKATLSLQTVDPPSTTSFFFGAPLSEDVSLAYARRSDEQAVYAVAAEEIKALFKSAADLRSKQCFNFSPENAAKIAVAWSGTAWAIEKNSTGSWVQTGAQTALDQAHAREFINTLAEAQATGFIDGASGSEKKYGLNPPAGTVSVLVDGSSKAEELAIGSALPASKERYGKLSERAGIVKLPEVFIAAISETTPEQLTRPPEGDKPGGPEHPLDDGEMDQY